MTNLELARQKREATEILMGAVESYQATADRLIAESSKLIAEAEALLQGDEHASSDKGVSTAPA